MIIVWRSRILIHKEGLTSKSHSTAPPTLTSFSTESCGVTLAGTGTGSFTSLIHSARAVGNTSLALPTHSPVCKASTRGHYKFTTGFPRCPRTAKGEKGGCVSEVKVGCGSAVVSSSPAGTLSLGIGVRIGMSVVLTSDTKPKDASTVRTGGASSVGTTTGSVSVGSPGVSSGSPVAQGRPLTVKRVRTTIVRPEQR